MKRYTFLVAAIAILALVVGPAAADTSVFKPDRASKMIGAQAVDPEGQSLGTVSDLVITKDNKLSYIVVTKADESAYVALPFEAVSPQVNPEGAVVLAVAKEDFDIAPSSASNKWIPPSDDSARGYRPGSGSAWQSSDFNEVGGIQTLNPHTF